MSMSNRLAKLNDLCKQSKDVAERFKLFVFFSQALGEDFGYSFEIHHYKVFSRDLEQDLERCELGNGVGNYSKDVCEFVDKQIRSTLIDELELGAAWIYFLQKGYSNEEIRSALKVDARACDKAQSLSSQLLAWKSKSLATSGVK